MNFQKPARITALACSPCPACRPSPVRQSACRAVRVRPSVRRESQCSEPASERWRHPRTARPAGHCIRSFELPLGDRPPHSHSPGSPSPSHTHPQFNRPSRPRTRRSFIHLPPALSSTSAAARSLDMSAGRADIKKLSHDSLSTTVAEPGSG